MRLETRACIDDILRAIANIRSVIPGVERLSFTNDWQVQSAVERQLLIVGEAVARIKNFEPIVFQQLPEGSKIIGLRNLLAHGYDAVDASAIYDLCDGPLLDLEQRALSLIKK